METLDIEQYGCMLSPLGLVNCSGIGQIQLTE